jgi:hypothetical protein
MSDHTVASMQHCLAMSCLAMSCLALLCRAVPCLALPGLALPARATLSCTADVSVVLVVLCGSYDISKFPSLCALTAQFLWPFRFHSAAAAAHGALPPSLAPLRRGRARAERAVLSPGIGLSGNRLTRESVYVGIGISGTAVQEEVTCGGHGRPAWQVAAGLAGIVLKAGRCIPKHDTAVPLVSHSAASAVLSSKDAWTSSPRLYASLLPCPTPLALRAYARACAPARLAAHPLHIISTHSTHELSVSVAGGLSPSAESVPELRVRWRVGVSSTPSLMSTLGR